MLLVNCKTNVININGKIIFKYILGIIIVVPKTIGSIVADSVKPPATPNITTNIGSNLDIKPLICVIISFAKSKEIIKVLVRTIIINA